MMEKREPEMALGWAAVEEELLPGDMVGDGEEACPRASPHAAAMIAIGVSSHLLEKESKEKCEWSWGGNWDYV